MGERRRERESVAITIRNEVWQEVKEARKVNTSFVWQRI